MKIYFDSARQHLTDRQLPPGAWKGQYLMNLIDGPEVELIKDFEAVTQDELVRTHDPKMVEDLLKGIRRNGYGTLLEGHMNKIRADCGSFIRAALDAHRHSECILSPTAGFHHAGYSRVSGYCTFNALIMAVQRLQEIAPKAIVSIIDGDAHWGDGVVELMQHHRLINVNYVSLADCRNLEQFLHRSNNAISASEVVFYQAGADSHEEDALGSGTLTRDELIYRDESVFRMAKTQGAGIVWNLAGGYGAPTVKSTMMVHYETWKAAMSVFGARANLGQSSLLET